MMTENDLMQAVAQSLAEVRRARRRVAALRPDACLEAGPEIGLVTDPVTGPVIGLPGIDSDTLTECGDMLGAAEAAMTRLFAEASSCMTPVQHPATSEPAA